MKLSASEKIIVIGRGIAGLSLAYRLVKAGYRPILIGSTSVPKNASRCAQGVLANKGLLFFDSPLFAAKLKSLNHVQSWLVQLEVDSGLEIERNFSGIYEPYWGSQDFQDLVGRIYRRQFWGCFQTQNLSSEQWPTSPFLSRLPQGCLYYPNDGWFDVRATLDALELILARENLEIFDDNIVAISQLAEGSFELQTESGNALKADRIVLASGSGSNDLLLKLSLTVPKSFVIGGLSLKLSVPYESPIPQTFVRGTFSATWRGYELIIGSSSWKGADIEEKALLEDSQGLMRDAEERFGWTFAQFRDFPLELRRGARYRFADRMPAVGPYPIGKLGQRLFLLNGFYKNGLHLADLCSQDLIAYLEGRFSDVQYPDFHPQRLFKTKSCSMSQGKDPLQP